MLKARLVALLFAVLTMAVWLGGCGEGKDGVATLQVLDDGGQPINASYVAFKDGNDGAWVQLTTTSPGVYAHKVSDPDGHYGFLVMAGNNRVSSAPPTVYYATLNETSIITHSGRATKRAATRYVPASNVPVSGTLSGVPEGKYWSISMGNDELSNTSSYLTYDLSVRENSTRDLIAGYMDDWDAPVTKFWLKRNVSVTGAMTQNIDFANDAEVCTPDSYTATVTGYTLDYLDATLYSAGGTRFDVGYVDGSNTLDYAALPADKHQAGDVYEIMYNGMVGNTSFSGLRSYSTPQNLTIDTGTITPFAQPTVDGNTVSWTAYPDAQAYMMIADCNDTTFMILMSNEWLHGATSCTVPLLADLPGFNWGGMQDAPVVINMAAYTSNQPLNVLMAAFQNGYLPAGSEAMAVAAESPMTMTRGTSGTADELPTLGLFPNRTQR